MVCKAAGVVPGLSNMYKTKLGKCFSNMFLEIVMKPNGGEVLQGSALFMIFLKQVISDRDDINSYIPSWTCGAVFLRNRAYYVALVE